MDFSGNNDLNIFPQNPFLNPPTRGSSLYRSMSDYLNISYFLSLVNVHEILEFTGIFREIMT